MILNQLNQINGLWNIRKTQLVYKRKILKLIKNTEFNSVIVEKESMSVRRYFPAYNTTHWHSFYASINGIDSPDYLPEDLYYGVIEPLLNNPAYRSIYMDKSCLGFVLEPDEYIGNSFFFNHGIIYDFEGKCSNFNALEKWALDEDEVVLKPSKESGGGRGVIIGNGEKALNHIKKISNSWVLQKVLKQHPYLEKIHPCSLNTIRMMTLRHQGDISIISSTLRMGVGDSRIDNGSNGGVSCGINNGVLRKFGYNSKLMQISEHPDSHIAFENVQIPSWDKIIEVVKRNHKAITELDILSWDIAVDKNGKVKIVEINVEDQEINMHQIKNGPVFGPYLSSMLDRIDMPLLSRYIFSLSF